MLRAKAAPEHIREAWIGPSWIVEVTATGTRVGKPFQATHLCCFMQRTSRCDTSLRTSRCDTSLRTFRCDTSLRTFRCDTSLRTSRCDTSLRTTPETLLQLVRDRWSIEGWHWISDTQLHEDAHRYRGNGAGAMATLQTAALNLLRLAGFRSIRAGMQAVMHDITALLVMAMRQPEPNPC